MWYSFTMNLYNVAMKLKKGFVFISIALLIFSGFTIYKLIRLNRQYRNALPYRLVGETIEYLSLESTNENVPSLRELPGEMVSILYIFSQPCTICDKNLFYLKKFTRFLDKSVVIRGVVIGNFSDAYKFIQNAEPGFDVYVPEDLNRFIDEFRIKFNQSHLLVCKGKEIKFVRTGELSSDGFPQILRTIRSMK